MTSKPPASEPLHHHVRRMTGRDIHAAHRVATPLELLFDLTFVAAFSLASSQFAHAVAASHFGAGLAGFAFASFAICWAWVNFSWFASAYDTDDWIFRLATMVQMTGVLVLAMGLPRMFASIEHGGHLDNSIMVLGYVIMRVAMLFQWLRAARQNPDGRRACLTYATTILIAQIGWIGQIMVDAPVGTAFLLSAPLFFIELAGPVIAERKAGGTPWHAHHIAERHGLFAIIALGEGVVGTLAALSAVIEARGWSLDAALACIAGTGLTFGMWWVYYILPSAPVLEARRDRSFAWGYSQMLVVASIVATGAGLHVAAYYIEGEAQIGPLAAVLAVTIPVGLFLALIYGLYTYLVGWFDRFHLWLLLGTAAVIALAVIAALNGADMALCLVILMLAPVVTILGYETIGHRHQAQALARLTKGD